MNNAILVGLALGFQGCILLEAEVVEFDEPNGCEVLLADGPIQGSGGYADIGDVWIQVESVEQGWMLDAQGCDGSTPMAYPFDIEGGPPGDCRVTLELDHRGNRYDAVSGWVEWRVDSFFDDLRIQLDAQFLMFREQGSPRGATACIPELLWAHTFTGEATGSSRY